MTQSAEHAKRPPISTGPLALLRALSLLALVLTGLLVLPGAASADGRIGGPNELPAEALPGGVRTLAGTAVSEAQGGAVYASDTGTGRVAQFSPAGAFLRAFGWGIVPGAAAGTGDITAGSFQVTNVTTTLGSFNTGFFGVGKILSGPGIPPGDEIGSVSSTEITLVKPAEQTATGVSLEVTAGPGNVPTNEIQKLTVAATGGEFRLSFPSPDPGSTTETTAPLHVNSAESKPSASEVQSALQSLSNIGAGNVSVTGGPADAAGTHPYLIEFKGRYADTNVRRLRVTEPSLSGGSPSSEASVTKSTEGAGALETCTSACMFASSEEGSGESGNGYGSGTQPGRLNHSEEIAIDNSCAEHEPPLTESTTPKCSEFDPSYGDVYVIDQRDFRVEKYDPEGHFLLMVGGQVNETKTEEGKPAAEQDLCTKAELEAGDVCGAGVPGSGTSEFAAGWNQEGNDSLAVGPDGTLYVGDHGRIQEFEPSGAFKGEFVLPLEQAGEEPTFVNALAINSAGDLFAHSETRNCCRVPGVREFGPGPSHTLLRTFATELKEETQLALDRSGDLFLTEHSATEPNELEFRAFKPTGALYAEFSSEQVTPFVNTAGQVQAPAQVGGIAVGAATEKLYATSINPNGAHIAEIPLPQPGPPQVAGLRVTDLEPKTATLHAVANPEQFDTTYQFQYITQKKYEEDANSFGAGTESTPATPADLGSVSREDPVQAPLSNLTPGTAYRWRLFATNSAGTVEPEQTFETLPPVSVRGFTTQLVAPEEVVLEAELDNNNSLSAGHWKILLCSDSSCLTPIAEKQGTLPAGSSSFEPIEATFTVLKPNTDYHYRLIAENQYTSPGHLEETAVQAFTTELSAAEEHAAEAAQCPNVTLREQNNSTRLTDCRAYEQVSPLDKHGYGVSAGTAGIVPNELAPSGERDLFHSLGAFAGIQAVGSLAADYVAHRTASGWLTESPLSFLAGPDQFVRMWGFNAELNSWLMRAFPKPPAGTSDSEPAKTALYLHSADGSTRPLAPPLRSAEGVNNGGYQLYSFAQSADFSRIYTESNYPLLASDSRAYAVGNSADRVYEIGAAGAPAPTLSLAAELSEHLGGGFCQLTSDEPRSESWASADGSTLFYAAPLELVPGESCGPNSPNKFAVFARIDAGAPIRLSAESPTQCTAGHPCHGAAPANAVYAGDSPDGSRAWFTTAQPLIDSDADTTDDLYLANLVGGQLTELVQASAGEANAAHPVAGQGAGVQGAVRVSEDGSHAAFVATGVLTEHESANALHPKAQAGADNLYVYDAASGETKFVARLCSSDEGSGSLKETACPANLKEYDAQLWRSPAQSAQLTPDGRYLLFPSFGRLTPDDTDNALDVYRYDFSTGRLIRLSFGRRGNDAGGNDDRFPAELRPQGIAGTGTGGPSLDAAAEDPGRSISTDGSTAIFQTAAPLVSRDTNAGTLPACGVAIDAQHHDVPGTGCDTYQWSEDGHGTCTEPGGCVSLVSDGVTRQGALAAVISLSGRDITFITSAGLAPADTDGVPDVYDARENGGFPYTPPPVSCGAAEICHGPVPPEPTPPKITSGGETGGNGPPQLKCAKGKVRVKKHGQIRCVAKKPHKAKKHHKRAAGRNRGGQK